MAECKRFIATWKESDEAAVWYEKSLHAAWYEGASEFADIVHTYQWLNESNIERTPCSDHGSSRAGPQQQGNGTRDLPQCARSKMQAKNRGTYHQRLHQARMDRVH